MNSNTHLAMAGWKGDNPGRDECFMQSFLAEPFPPDPLVEDDIDNEGSDAGFQKHGLSVAVVSPQMEGKPPPTPQFGQKSGSSSRLSERMQARAGFSVPKLSMPCIPPAAADSSHPGATSPYLTIPAGLSPASLLESPVFLSNSMGQASPTTGKLLMFGDMNSNNPSRLEGPSVEDGTGAFSSKYIAEEKKESLLSNQHPQLQIREVSVKTETAIQKNTQDASSLGQLNQQQFNGLDMMKRSSYLDSKRSRLTPETTAVVSPPDHGQPAAATDGEPKGEYPALAVAMPAAEDGYSWRKYGQKQVKHSEYPRSYYKCTHPSCQVKKKVEQSFEGNVTEIIYKGTHSHPKPARSRRPGSPHVHSFSDAQADAADNSHGHHHHHHPASQQQTVDGRPLWHNGGTVQHLRGEGLEATSSPSVPGELCDTSHSMQVHDSTARFESPEGVDITSAVSDEVDGGDRVAARGSMSQGHGAATDAEGDELESKRRKLESCSIEMSTASRAVREPRVVIQTTSEVDILDDGYRWRKYGQKVVKGNPNPRSYYKCTHQECLVRKHVERASHDHKSVITTYEGKHNHEVPAARNSGGHASSAAYGAAAASQALAGGARRPEPPSLQLGSCAAPYGIGLPPRDPLGPMSNYPYTLGGGHAAVLPSLPMPVGLGGMERLKLPMLSPSLNPFYRQRQAMETAGFRVPKGEAKDEAPPTNGGAAPPGYQQPIGRLPLGHRM